MGPALRGVSRALPSMSLRCWEIPCKCIVQGKLAGEGAVPQGLCLDCGLVRMLLSSPRKFLSETFESDHVRTTMAAWGMHLDFAPDMAGGAVFPYLESMANQNFGMVIGKGGADTVTQALVSKIEASGGEVHCGKPGGAGRAGKAARPQESSLRTVPGSRPTRPSSPMWRPAGLMSLIEGNPAMQDLTARWRLRPCAGHDDDPPGARRPAGLDRER
jgi:hypothetical protein